MRIFVFSASSSWIFIELLIYRNQLGWGHGQGWYVNCRHSFFKKKYGGRGASGRRGDRPTTCTVPEASQERVRYASAPGCPGHGRASCALTDLHTHSRQRRNAGTLKCTLLYTCDALPPRVAGDLPGIHNRTRLRRRIDAGGPLAGPPSSTRSSEGPDILLCRGLCRAVFVV